MWNFDNDIRAGRRAVGIGAENLGAFLPYIAIGGMVAIGLGAYLEKEEIIDAAINTSLGLGILICIAIGARHVLKSLVSRRNGNGNGHDLPGAD